MLAESRANHQAHLDALHSHHRSRIHGNMMLLIIIIIIIIIYNGTGERGLPPSRDSGGSDGVSRSWQILVKILLSGSLSPASRS
jgi:hypothetical protein